MDIILKISQELMCRQEQVAAANHYGADLYDK